MMDKLPPGVIRRGSIVGTPAEPLTLEQRLAAVARYEREHGLPPTDTTRLLERRERRRRLVAVLGDKSDD